MYHASYIYMYITLIGVNLQVCTVILTHPLHHVSSQCFFPLSHTTTCHFPLPCLFPPPHYHMHPLTPALVLLSCFHSQQGSNAMLQPQTTPYHIYIYLLTLALVHLPGPIPIHSKEAMPCFNHRPPPFKNKYSSK